MRSIFRVASRYRSVCDMCLPLTLISHTEGEVMKRKECEKENDSSVSDLPSSKRRRGCPSLVLGEITQFSIKEEQDEEEFVLGRRKDVALLKEEEGRDIKHRAWNRLTQDESLWKRLDLGSKTLSAQVLSLIAARGLLALRLCKASILPRALTPPKSPFRVQYLDLSMSDFPLPSLASFLSYTRDLRKVAMEHCFLDEDICALLAKNTNLTVLHLAMELNISWTDLSEEAIAFMCQNIPPSVRRLNIAGCKDYLQDKHLLQLMRNLPNLKELDISDAGSVSEETIDSMLLYLKKLEHLSVSRCYGISPNSYIYLSVLTSLKNLTVFGTMKDAAIQELRLHLPGIHINKYMFSTIARPTVGIRKTSIWNVRKVLKILITSFFILDLSTFYLYNDKSLLCISGVSDEQNYDVMDFDTNGNGILGIGSIGKTPLIFTRNKGLITVTPTELKNASISITDQSHGNDSRSTSLLFDKISTNPANLSVSKVGIDNLTSSKSIPDQFKGAFLCFCEDNMRTALSIVEDLFPPGQVQEGEINSSTNKVIVQVSRDVIDDYPAMDPLGLWKRMSGVVVDDSPPMSTHLALAEHLEKIVAALALRNMKAEFSEVIEKAIKIVLKDRSYYKKTGNLTPQDHFYREVSKVEQIYCFSSCNRVVLSIIKEAVNYRSNKLDEFLPLGNAKDLEYLPWTSSPGPSGDQLIALGSTNNCKSISERREEVGKQYEKDRLSLIMPLITNEYYEEAASLAEKYFEFGGLVKLCEITNDKERLERYMDRFAAQKFSDFVFDWHVKEGKQGRLLSQVQKSGNRRQEELGRFLSGHAGFSWVHDVQTNKFKDASLTLKKLALNETEILARKKTMLSLSKLTALASDENERGAQEQLPLAVLEAFNLSPDSMNVLSPKEIIELYISDENFNADHIDFKKALDLMDYIRDMDIEDKEALKLHIWARSILRNNWENMDAANPVDSVKETTFFKLAEFCQLQGLELQCQLLSYENLLGASELHIMPVQQRPQRMTSLQPPVPPPYRAPPNPAQPFSKLNVSEPNIQDPHPIRSMSPKNTSSYRHTINHDSSQAVQHGLKNMLHDQRSGNSSKHATLDGSTQNIALQQLRNHMTFERGGLKGNGLPNSDSLRDSMSRSFSQEDPNSKRLSYNNNIPPKPRSKEQSKYDLENDPLEAELKHILREGGGSRNIHNHGNSTPPLPALSPESSPNNEDVNSVTTTDMGDAQAIRKQLDSLEGMYSEVLKMLGLRKFGRPDTKLGTRRGGKLYGSMSSLPSVSSIGSRHLYHASKDKRRDGGVSNKRNGGSRDNKATNKRFQRLESHVVTLARSVAHLSSEMRAQQIIMQQELEGLRKEVQMSRHHGNRLSNVPFTLPNQKSKVSPVHAKRVRKLTHFFGDEPPLLRIFLKNLGYEKYASVFEDSKIGLLELPYLSEDTLEKLGIPMGPRMRILQEAKSNIANESDYNVYIL
ncbi:NUP133 [Lepeophtheirus salmonis]|uniref:NUP133 n=1 Tax=Lepeophtheirus salmonis TaxID=72036 RepID=A0A7R8H3N6_LEPSM|nr:NUP133 [Lepeophtheirus salmonis]CAF2846903.1 NUP133 [Lepeophtheirus salmonis]